MRWGFVLARYGNRHDLVEGGLHAVELELTHEVEQLSSLAAPTPSSQLTFTTYSLPVSRRTHSRRGLLTRAVTNS
jgi:hypothetical protein